MGAVAPLTPHFLPLTPYPTRLLPTRSWVEWYQVDAVYSMIRLLELLGLAWDVKIEVPVKRDHFEPTGWEVPMLALSQGLFLSLVAIYLHRACGPPAWLRSAADQLSGGAEPREEAGEVLIALRGGKEEERAQWQEEGGPILRQMRERQLKSIKEHAYPVGVLA